MAFCNNSTSLTSITSPLLQLQIFRSLNWELKLASLKHILGCIFKIIRTSSPCYTFSIIQQYHKQHLRDAQQYLGGCNQKYWRFRGIVSSSVSWVRVSGVKSSPALHITPPMARLAALSVRVKNITTQTVFLRPFCNFLGVLRIGVQINWEFGRSTCALFAISGG